MGLPQFQWQDDFEDGITGWGVTNADTAVVTLSHDTSVAYSGRGSLKIAIDNSAGGAADAFNVNRVMDLGGGGAVLDAATWTEVRAMVRPSAVPAGLTIVSAGTGATAEALAAETWTWNYGESPTEGGGLLNVNLAITVPAGAVLDIWLDWVRIELRYTEGGAPQPEPVLLPIRWNVREPVRETITYPCSVVPTQDGGEVRAALRLRPRVQVSALYTARDAQEAAILERLLWRNQAGRWRLPWWPEETRVTSWGYEGEALCDTTLRTFTPVTEDVLNLLLYRGISDWLETGVRATDTGEVTPWDQGGYGLPATQPVTRLWFVPLRTGRLLEAVRVVRPNGGMAEVRATFEYETEDSEPTAAAAPALTFRDVEVVTRPPSRDVPPDETWTWPSAEIGSTSGARSVRTSHEAPIVERPFRWVLIGPSQVAAVRAWLAARLGRARPCWVPTFRFDLPLAASSAPGSETIHIRAMGYAAAYADQDARTTLALIAPNLTVTPATVIGAVDNGDGTETLTLDAPLAAAVTVGATMVSWLTFARLRDDAAQFEHYHHQLATMDVTFVELTRERPPAPEPTP